MATNLHEKLTVTAIVITYDRKEFVQQALASLLAQTVFPDKVIVLWSYKDVCSIVDGFSISVKSMYFPPKIPLGDKLNSAMEAVDTDTAFILCDDDMLDPTFIERTMKAMSSGVDIVYTDARFFGMENRPEFRKEWKVENFRNTTVPLITSLFAKDIWKRTGGFRNIRFLDWDFWYACLNEGAKVRHVKEQLFLYRTHTNQDSRGLTRDMIEKGNKDVLDKRLKMIPKIIHQMWIGDKSKRPVELMHTWKIKNPTCEYKMWTEVELADFGFCNQNLIDLMPELNGKCDIMRYEILHRCGGFFVDADTECINELDDFFFENERFTCYENETRTDLLASGFMGCQKNDELFTKCIDSLSKIRVLNNPAWVVCGPRFFTDIVDVWKETLPIKIYPSWYFMPEHGTGQTYKGEDKIYSRHYWGSTFQTYGEQMNTRELRDNACVEREQRKNA